ncbi:MAG: DUF3592 domain-containing protein [Gammaproteobacteria bacterium]|nr:DUF3592 domain-containing protein [Gammaproteobacteria bacterium]MCP5196443.1 DUF3592 domain-containing protein [Gammaproteobacteria bacterium]
MTDLSAASLHPSLQKLSAAHRRLTRLLSLLFFLIMAGALIFMMTTALSNRSMENLLIFAVAGLVMLPMIALMWGLLWYLERWTTRRITVANQLLRENTPLSVRLTPAGLNSRFGTLMLLQILDQQAASGPLYALIEPNSGWSQPPHQAMTGHLYCQDLQIGRRLIALHDDKVLIGKLVDGKVHYRQMQWVSIAVLAVVSIVATVAGFLGFREYQAYQDLDQQQRWAKASADWLQTPGQITRAELTVTKIPKGAIRVDGYWPQIEFAYSVTGVTHSSDMPFFCNQPTTNREIAETWLAQYPSGAAVTVYHDPADPARGVLKAGYTAVCQATLKQKQWDILLKGGMTGFLLATLLVLVIMLRGQRRQARAFLEP